MDLVIHIPESVERQLEQAFGQDLAGAAREALAIEGYRTERLSLGQVAELLGISCIEADAFLKERDIPLLYTIEDYEHDRVSLRQGLGE